jgi:NAD(P)-dependent dehydrogenase (short-subunit alcohol dehydrogenase family)
MTMPGAFSLDGKVAIVTGASSGLGVAMPRP